jgi:two-component system sensor histidine kinase EvgS
MPSATAKLLHAEFMAQLQTRKPHFNERQLLLHSGVVTVYQWTVPFYGEDGRLGGLVGGWSDFGKRRRQF